MTAPGRDERLLFAEGDRLACFQGGPGAKQAGRPDHGGHNYVDLRGLDAAGHGLRVGQKLSAGGKRGLGARLAGEGNPSRAEPLRLGRELGASRPGAQADHFEQIGQAADHVKRVGSD